MALLTAFDYLYQALRRCGQMRPGYTPGPELLMDGLNEWWLMFDGFNTRRTMNFTVPDYIYPITGPGHAVIESGQSLGAGLGFYIGPGASDFNGPRPVAIVRMNLYMTSASPSNPTRIPLSPVSAEEWANISVLKLTPINVTNVFYYEAAWPYGIIWVWPPLNGNSLEIFTWGQLVPPGPSIPPTLTQAYSAPPGYADVIVLELAKRLWPMCTKKMMVNRVSHQWLCGQAAIAKRAVMNVNAPMPRLSNDFQGGRGHTVGTSDWELLLTGT